MKKLFLLFLVVVLAVSFMACGGTTGNNEPEIDEGVDEGQEVLGEGPEEGEEPPDEIAGSGGVVWVVNPAFPYEGVGYCPVHETFFSYGGAHLDPKTGMETGEFCGHGGGWINFMYDPAENIFGVAYGSEGDMTFSFFTESELAAQFHFYMDKLIMIEKFDSTKVKEIEEPDWGTHDLQEASTYKYAVSLGTEMLSEFIYDGGEMSWRLFNDVIAVELDNRWGIIDINGNIVIPFEFEHAISIDNETAFAKLDGKVGIVQIP